MGHTGPLQLLFFLHPISSLRMWTWWSWMHTRSLKEHRPWGQHSTGTKTYCLVDYQSRAWFPTGTLTRDILNRQQNLDCLWLISFSEKCQYFLSVFQIMGKNEAKKMWTVGALSIHYFLQRLSAYNRDLQAPFSIIIKKLSLDQGSAVSV